ncbi:pyridoxine 5'-phosphate synthase [Gammaproteobacteria bacterium]|nr:pyridoxine 5'-phosphate synthase [Gammaproteobacteria bacterium]
MPCKLSVNVNKIATLRNARGGDKPSVVQFAERCEALGADGITVHPRPDERHIRRSDVLALAAQVRGEFNIEGNPQPDFLALVESVRPAQVTLVPDGPDVLTSNQGWDTLAHQDWLTDVVAQLKSCGMRVSLFLDPLPAMVESAARCGADRIELYTEAYANAHAAGDPSAAEAYRHTAAVALEAGLGLNAGHDLKLDNLADLLTAIPQLDEVSIGHALVSECLYRGLEKTLTDYRAILDT